MDAYYNKGDKDYIMDIIVLNDGETFSDIQGATVYLDVSDEYDTEQIEDMIERENYRDYGVKKFDLPYIIKQSDHWTDRDRA